MILHVKGLEQNIDMAHLSWNHVSLDTSIVRNKTVAGIKMIREKWGSEFCHVTLSTGAIKSTKRLTKFDKKENAFAKMTFSVVPE
eukprot:scaffold4717_cov53-Attheya_sp.AAC.3